MSFLDINNMSYMSYIEQCFLHFRGVGTQLSAKEYNLISQWQYTHIPREVIAVVIADYHDQMKQTEGTFPRSLLYFQKPVEEAFLLYQEKKVGSSY